MTRPSSDNPFAVLRNDSEDAKNFFITEDEVYSASDDVDLLSSPAAVNNQQSQNGEDTAPGSSRRADSLDEESENVMMDELEVVTNNLVSSASSTVVDTSDENTFRTGTNNARDNDESGDTGDETDDDDYTYGDESTFGICIDDEIVNNVLESSEERIQERKDLAMKKYSKYAMMVFSAFIIFLVMVESADIMIRRQIRMGGSAYQYDDREDVSDREEEGTILHEHIDYGSAEYAKYFFKAAEVMGQPFDPSAGEVPFFFQMPSVCATLEGTLAQCLGLVIAGDKPGPPELQRDELVVYDYGEQQNTTTMNYINVDLSNGKGVKRAEMLNLVASGLPDVIMTGLLHFGLNALFPPDTAARMFTVVRHPVDLAISSYYDFTENVVDEVLRNMPLEEFIESNYYEGNALTKIICGYGKPEPPTEDQLHLAQEILRTKFVVGLHDDLADSITLFEDYFYWGDGNMPETRTSCKNELRELETQRELDMYYKVGRVKAGSVIYQKIVEQNALDLELYWYAVDLHRAQRVWIPPQE